MQDVSATGRKSPATVRLLLGFGNILTQTRRQRFGVYPIRREPEEVGQQLLARRVLP